MEEKFYIQAIWASKNALPKRRWPHDLSHNDKKKVVKPLEPTT